ncbi:DUF488 family protein [Streptomyces hygroscopicus]|uniref:DUF488 family protein n=1 Tax=Streptomyces hygroscopicus TaxID=1912 RepID=UPI000767B198|nr:DUF488 family protein [Streptomyces hygroscopicus]
MLTLFTNRYQAYQPPQGVPVRITLGAPRSRLAYQLRHVVRELAPRKEYFSKPLPEFTSAYRADLDRLGATWIAARLQEIAETEKEHRLVLLCFEDLTDPAQWCHRRIFAKWWKDVTGDEVRELGRLADHYEQGTLL